MNEIRTRRLFIALVIVASVIGAWLRLDQITAQVLIEDEWHPVHQLLYYTPRQVIASFGNADYCIPLVLLYFLEQSFFPLSELALRWPSLVAGIVTVMLLPLLWRRQVGSAAAIGLALFLAVSPVLVSYSRIARPYAITVLGIYLAFFALQQARVGTRLRWPYAGAYSILCGLVVWTHAITGPTLVAPLAILWWHRMRAGVEATAWRDLLLLTVATGACMGMAVFPPLLGDAAALAGKAGVDQIGWQTVVGAWFLWMGTGSGVVAVVALVLAGVGLPAVWRCSPVSRWIVVGSAMTISALLLSQPWWVDRPPAFARYLLPLAPLFLLAIGKGIELTLQRATGALGLPPANLLSVAMAAAAIVIAWWPTSPNSEILRRPNSYAQHSFFQYDYRPDSPLRIGLPGYPRSTFWRELASRTPGSVTVAVAPFRYSTFEWPAPLWEQESRQRVIPAYLWGTCVSHREGETPPRRGIQFRNAINLSEGWERQDVDYIAYFRSPTRPELSPPMPECEAWMRQHLGEPFHEDEALVVWARPPPRKGA